MFKMLSKLGQSDGSSAAVSRRAEFIVFAIIVVFIWPIITVGFVGGYGFLVWMSQLVFGPPGPPAG
ncbi:MAG TPA: nitrate reductase [Xanthobacteraceae bacterium]|jgi:nitrate reductase NapE|nr:nitrate reductase [Xanthobacteraceae bacterium]